MSKIILDEHQQRAAEHREGWALVDAAAGAGKTQLAIERARILVTSGVAPESILLLAYNTAAAEQLRERLKESLGAVTGGRVDARTFHSFAQTTLNKIMGDDPAWKRTRVLDTQGSGSSLRAMAEAIKGAGVKGDAKDWVATSNYIRESAVDLDSEEACDRIELLKPFRGNTDRAPQALRVCRAFQYEKTKQNALDFTDMVYYLWRFTKDNPKELEAIFGKYRHVMVDETQDSTPLRWAIIRHLGKSVDSLLCVSDTRQSLYSYSGSDIAELMHFKNHEAKVVYNLPVNRRSTDSIVELGNAVCRGYAWHSGDALSLPENGEGKQPILWHTRDEHEEADRVADEISSIFSEALLAQETDSKFPMPKIAVLARTNGRLLLTEQALKDKGLRTKVRGQTGGMWGSMEGRDVLAYLELGAGIMSDESRNVANKPTRYIKTDFILNCITEARGNFDSFVAGLRRRSTGRSRGMADFADTIVALRAMKFDLQVQQVKTLLIRHVEAEQHREDGSPITAATPDEDKSAAYRALCEVAARYPDFKALKKSIAEAEEDEEVFDVELSSCHRMKGGEADHVFVIGACQGMFPHVKATDLEEERRIFYVAITRAKRTLTISTGGAPSPFLRSVSGLVKELGKPVPAAEVRAIQSGTRDKAGDGGNINSAFTGAFLKRRRM